MRKHDMKQILAAVCAAVIACTVHTAAGSKPEIHETEVPEGWTGIRTAEELNNIRYGLEGNYILMNDIEIPESMYEKGGLFENGFVPIGQPGNTNVQMGTDSDGHPVEMAEKQGAFTGIFDGNGYVISNLRIRSWNVNTAGLFGSCETALLRTEYSTEENSVRGDSTYTGGDGSGMPYRYRVSAAGGVIRNLGIEDSSVILTADQDGTVQLNGKSYPANGAYSSLYVGMIAGYCDVITGCYTRNVEVQVEITGDYHGAYESHRISAGGVVGCAEIAADCWSDAAVSVKNLCSYAQMQQYTGGICGSAVVCRNVSFSGNISADTGETGVCYMAVGDLPLFLTESMLRDAAYRLLCMEYETVFSAEAMKNMTLPQMEQYAMQTAKKSKEAYGFVLLRDGYDSILLTDPSGQPQKLKSAEILYMQDPALRDHAEYTLRQYLEKAYADTDLAALFSEYGIVWGFADLREGEAAEPVWYRDADGVLQLRVVPAAADPARMVQYRKSRILIVRK
ncbi:MAG: hypothetical protein IJ480_05020 [Clostridia bacterium]|nr:hypothetical protein [Clostridia bacterium]